ncbi:ubiquitin specific protease [Fadolivirus algeromassiliense]|jgi:hypothetical protein|uniref:Ubiquitin specific protease n=1 Tax=Fadolivirus FV1/VV64 TaxID=3070911 RepID=A0A7D3QUI5_9VIRU|nr:ubiquitin specific protease [Fadolivirus algeromassiliense]QKF94163.1 ubiquitin specific protease [Fadolivirus FV1/VV64]
MSIPQILTNINHILQRRKLLNDLTLLKPKAGNYPLAPGIEWHANICFFSAIMQLIYRIEELVPFLIHTNIRNQYKQDSIIQQYIDFLQILYQKAHITENNIFTVLEQQNITNKCITGVGSNFGSWEDPSQIGTPILNILNDICFLHYIGDDPNKWYNLDADYENICNINKFTLPKTDPRTFIGFDKFTYRCYLNIFMPKSDFTVIDKGNKIHSESKMDEYIIKNNDKIQDEKKKCNYNLNKKEHISILTIESKDFTGKIEDKINEDSIEIRHAEFNDTTYQLFIEKEIRIPNKYFVCDISNKTRDGHNITLCDSSGKIHLKYGDREKHYELIGGLRYSPGHWTAYIKHNTVWYFYDGSRRVIQDISDHDSRMLYTLLYREVNDELFDTIDPEIVPNNLEQYLTRYGSKSS